MTQNLERKLQSLIGTSQSYSVSFNLSQNQQEQTPVQQKIEVQRFRETTSLNKIHATGNSSRLSTPEPQSSQPRKVEQQQRDQQELDDLIESLNSRYRSCDYQLSKTQTQTQTTKSLKEPAYSQNLFEVIQFLDEKQATEQNEESLSQSSQYQQLMDKYARLADEYEDF